MSLLPIFAYASGIAANDKGCALGPAAVHEALSKQPELSNQLQWVKTYQPMPNQPALATVTTLCHALANDIRAIATKQFFAVIGGDHSCAIGTWNGVKASLPKEQRLGLIWIDAHLDSHTTATTLTGNIHGMPVAALLGHGNQALTTLMHLAPVIDPRDLFFIGIRSYEAAEMDLIKRLGIRVYAMAEVEQRGLPEIFNEICHYFSVAQLPFGLSLDLDVFDPEDAPGVGMPARDGLRSELYFSALPGILCHPRLCGIEFAEFNPLHDRDEKTCRIILRHFEVIDQLRKNRCL